MDNMDRQIRYFLKIAELKSFSRAADELDMDQSGLSRQLAALETWLQKPLFVRTGRGVTLTDAGQLLQTAARGAYESIDETLAAIREKEGISQGNVRLATVHTLSYYFMSDVVTRFVSKREHVNLSLLGRSSPEVVELVESGKADLGFVYDSAVASPNLLSTPLFEDEMRLIVRAGSTDEQEIDLLAANCKLVGFPPHYALRKMLHSGGLQPVFVAEAETVDAMLKLVSSGIGACVLPSRIPDKLLAEYQLKKIRISRPLLKRRVIAITRAGRTQSPLVSELIAIALSIPG